MTHRFAWSCPGLAALLSSWLLLGCTAELESGRFRCRPEDPGSCPFDWHCLPQGTEHRCFPEVPPDRCGDARIDPGEQCDGTNIPGSCADFGKPAGALLCLLTCRVYCTACGNGRVEMTEEGTGEQCDDGNLLSHDGCSSGCTLEAPQWRRWRGGLARGRTIPGMVYDDARQRVVLFGGADDVGLHDDTWELGAGGWRRVQTTRAPAPRTGTDMVYDEAGSRVVLFGGADGSGQLLGDTWTFDGVDWSRVSAAAAPSAREGHAMAYDARRGRVVLFGGADAYGPAVDTWELDGDRWAPAQPETSPPERINHVMAYHQGSGQVVLFSGSSLFGSPRTDTWTYDGTTWREVSSPLSPPSRVFARLAHDHRRARLLLFGGFEFPTSTVETDLWAFDGAAWSLVATVGAPPARFQAGMAYDSARERLILFGGRGSDLFGDTWELDGDTWTDATRPTAPPARAGALLVHGEAFGATVLYGGRPDLVEPSTKLGDTWLFDGSSWTEATPLEGPPAMDLPAGAYDPELERVILFGGVDGAGALSDETWAFDGVTWTRLQPQGATPAPRFGAAMAYDPRRQRIVLFGGQGAAGDLDDTWELHGDAWLERALSEAPPPRRLAALRYDRNRQALVLAHGAQGVAPLSDLWAFDGERWTRLRLEPAPDGRAGLSMTPSSIPGLLVLFGGEGSLGLRADTWTLREEGWRPLEVAITPPALSQAGMAYDVRRRTVVLFGGYPINSETWELRLVSTHPDEHCDNGSDDDGDGLTDCDDPDCNAEPRCAPVEWCDGLADADGDGLVGCQDPSCGGATCGPHGLRCSDLQCTCPRGSAELDCGNGVDDDCNGLVDCADPACAQSQYCQAGGACQPAAPLGCGDLVEGTTAGGPENQATYACYDAGAHGPEAYFRLRAEAAVTVTVRITSPLDLELLVFGAFAAGACDIRGPCLAVSQNPPQVDEVSFDVAAGEQVFVVVDGFQAAAGPYTLSVTCQ